MAGTPEVRNPTSVEPPPPDLFGAAQAGAAVAKPEAPQTCCGRYLYLAPVICVSICLIIAAGVNIAMYEGEPIPGTPPPSPWRSELDKTTTAGAATTAVPPPPPVTGASN